MRQAGRHAVPKAGKKMGHSRVSVFRTVRYQAIHPFYGLCIRVAPLRIHLVEAVPNGMCNAGVSSEFPACYPSDWVEWRKAGTDIVC
jgi:hypothetical protein